MEVASVIFNNKFRILTYEKGEYGCRVELPSEFEKIHRDRLEEFLELQLISAHTSCREVKWNFKDPLIEENKKDCADLEIVLGQDRMGINYSMDFIPYVEPCLTDHAKTIFEPFLTFVEDPKNYYKISPLVWRKPGE